MHLECAEWENYRYQEQNSQMLRCLTDSSGLWRFLCMIASFPCDWEEQTNILETWNQGLGL